MKIFSTLFLMAFVSLALGCNSDTKGENMTPTLTQEQLVQKDVAMQEKLLQKTFVIETVNGKILDTKERIPEMNFGEDSRLTGGVCNRFTGQYTLVNGILKAGQVASTKMLCGNDELNKLENLFFVMLTAGAQVSLDSEKLTLVEGENTLVYTLKK